MISYSHIRIDGSDIEESSVIPKLHKSPEHNCPPLKEGIPKSMLEGFGDYTGFRLLPYTLQNHYGRNRSSKKIKTIIYENSQMKAVFLPEYGGRLYSLFHKPLNRELLTVNPVFQPANLANRNAWFSGGVEWNLGRYGHTFLTCEDVYFGVVKNKKGDECLRLYAFERMTKLFYHIDFYLPEDRPVLISTVHVYNVYDKPAPLYYWSNTAVPQTNSRVFASTRDVLYLDPKGSSNDKGEPVSAFGFDTLPSLGNVNFDPSFPERFTYSSEFFYQIPESEQNPWEAVAYDDGHLFFEYSTQPLRVRKMFCWGTHSGGNRWQEFLTRPGEDAYVEVQAGIHPTQCHTKPMEPNSHICWTQVFGGLYSDNTDILMGDFSSADSYVAELMKPEITYMSEYEQCMDSFKLAPVDNILHHGTPWGALELQHISMSGASVHLPQCSFTFDGPQDRSAYGKKLLAKEKLSLDLNTDPLGYVVDPSWEPLIREAKEQAFRSGLLKDEEVHTVQLALLYAESDRRSDALSLLEGFKHENCSSLFYTILGVLYRAALEDAHASVCVEKYKKETAVAFRKALERLDKTNLPFYRDDLYMEYADFLFSQGLYKELWNIVSDDADWYPEELRVLRALTAFQVGEYQVVDDLFTHSLERIREGDNRVSELWFAMEAHRQGKENTLEFRRSVKPPKHIDFRMSQ